MVHGTICLWKLDGGTETASHSVALYLQNRYSVAYVGHIWRPPSVKGLLLSFDGQAVSRLFFQLTSPRDYLRPVFETPNITVRTAERTAC